ncbi:hypothetical protein BU16DRAFT_159920 [Lophium mytilinum]|uniref:Uncharacterized protein n=1 Tax=Lophium mytilinum TaxID=390894 RepID=A0A6A6QGQ4_9PEZI|nr:hypothetical protein BU16DRAFT_159920 [Lophium mytilinum]
MPITRPFQGRAMVGYTAEREVDWRDWKRGTRRRASQGRLTGTGASAEGAVPARSIVSI